MTTFSTRLREALAKQRFSNRKIAEEIGVSPTSIANMLSGENKPNIETVSKLVDTLKINGHWLLTGEGDMYPQYATDSEGLRIEVDYLKRALRDKEEIITLLKQRQ